MNWVTRRSIRVNRTATAWLIRRFLDPAASFLFVAPEDVAKVQKVDDAVGFDAPGATYPHRDGKGRCSFEALAEERLPDDAALRALARIVHGADFDELHVAPEAAGLANDEETVAKASFLYDALYAALKQEGKP